MVNDDDIIYSSDGSGVNLAKKKKKEVQYIDIDPGKTTLKLQMEKKGRGGKAVTIIHNLPNNPPYFKKLSKALKSFCGTGGSFKNNQIEIQGDQREKLRPYLLEKGFIVKG